MNLVRVTAVDDGTPIFFNADDLSYCFYVDNKKCTLLKFRGDNENNYLLCKESPLGVAELIRGTQP